MKVFVSYSRTDVEAAHRIVATLEGRLDPGIELHLARHDLVPGAEFYPLDVYFGDSDALMLIIESAPEPDVPDIFEWAIEWAKKRNRRIIPVLVDHHVDISALHPALRALQIATVRSGHWDADIAALASTLGRLRRAGEPLAKPAAYSRSSARAVPLMAGLALVIMLTLMFWARSSPSLAPPPPPPAPLSPEVGRSLIRFGARLASIGLIGGVGVLILQLLMALRIWRLLGRPGDDTSAGDNRTQRGRE